MTMSSSIDDSIMSVGAGLPQHLRLDAARAGGEAAASNMPPVRRPARGRGAGGLALACCATLLASAPAACHGLSLSMSASSPATTRSLVDRARRIREMRSGGGSEARRRKLFVDDGADLLPGPQLDSDALSAALFDDGFNNSLEGAVANLKKKKAKGVDPAKRQAEEFDRLMEEDATVASMVHETIKPGSLVDAVQSSKGPDVDMEAFLQREAADRRRKLATKNDAQDVSSLVAPPAKVTRKAKLASQPRASTKTPPKATSKKSTLLTKEQEYALARTIQAGARVHKLKAEYVAAHSHPPSKKEWARLADMSPNDLRKLVSDYRTAKQELVASNVGLVHAVARSHARKAKYKGVSLDELVQEGSLGLIRAAELFDPAKGLRFSTYATIWIKGVLSNGNPLGEVIALPHRERAVHNKIRRAWEEMALERGAPDANNRVSKPTVDSAKELAERLGMRKDLVETHLRNMNCVSNVLSLDYQYTSASRSGYAESNKQTEALMASSQFGTDADLAEVAQFRADVVAGLVRNLSEREVTLMRLRYGLEDGTEYTIKDCAEKMGINRETARLLQHACLRKLREASNMESLQEYLLTVA